jgi:hypothetical protein
VETVLGLLLVVGIILLVRRFSRRGRGRGRFKCHDCRFMRKMFDDGVMCGYGDAEVFKNPRHIAMCPDWALQLKAKR